MSDTAIIGHNLPPDPMAPLFDVEGLPDTLAELFPDLIKRRDDLLAAVGRWRDLMTAPLRDANGVPMLDKKGNALFGIAIGSDEHYGKSVDFAAQLRDTLAHFESVRVTMKAPFIQAGKITDGFFNSTLPGTLAADLAVIREVINARARAVAAAERAEAARRAQAEMEAAARLAKAAEAARSQEAMDHAVALEQAAVDRLAEAHASRAGQGAARVQTSLGTTATLAGRWVFKITDPSLVPRQYCAPDPALLRIAVRQATVNGECALKIAGVEITLEQNVSLR